MGYGQFISSSYRAYAIDYDGDGYADLFNSVPDAVASIANYLKKHGWKRDGAIVKRVELNKVSKTYKHQNNINKYIPLKFTEGKEEKYIVQEGDSLLSIAQMPKGIPVGTLAIGEAGAANAALLAISILALNDKTINAKYEKWRSSQTKSVPLKP